MKRSTQLIGLFLGVLISFPLRGVERPEVTATMRGVFNSLMDLQTYVVSAERFADKNNRSNIQKDLKSLSSIKHAFPKKMQDEEPGAAIIASLFVDYLKDIQSRYKNGDYEYARHRVRTVTGYCFSCHSRVTTTKNFEDLSHKVETLKLSPFEKADFYAATRQFEKSLKLYTEILSATPKDEMEIIQFTRSLRRAVGITVRVKQSAKETGELINAVAKRKDLPEFIKRFSDRWKQDVQGWVEDKGAENLKGEALVEKAEKLIERASILQSFPADENGDISYLRASNYLHEALDGSPKASYRGKATYLLGVAYAAIQDPSLWDVDRLYFEVCIRENPKTDIAKKCYARYSDKVYLGYTGSAGTNIPEDELKKLGELRKLTE